MTKIFIRDEDGCNAADTGAGIKQQQMAGIFGRSRDAGLLSTAWANPQTRLLLLHGPTGIGKTALLHKWLHSLQQKGWHDAEAVYVWSFYPPDLAHSVLDPVEEFFQHALSWFGGKEAAHSPKLLQGEVLAKLVQTHHVLLVLDGLEILQSQGGSSIGRLVDPRLNSLLECLAEHSPGLCVAVSRKPLLGNFSGKPGVKRHELEMLPVEDGVRLLRYNGVTGEDDKLREMAVDFGQNPLTLNLLGGYLAVWHQGDWRRMDQIPILLDHVDEGRQVRRLLMANAVELADTPEEALLYLLSMLYRPTRMDTLANLIEASRSWPFGWFQKKRQDSYASRIGAFGRLNKRKQYAAVLQLRQLGLVSLSGGCFCLPQWVRETYQRQLKYDWPITWKETNRRLMLFHSTLPKEPELPDISPLLATLPQPRVATKLTEAMASAAAAREISAVAEAMPLAQAVPQPEEAFTASVEVPETLAAEPVAMAQHPAKEPKTQVDEIANQAQPLASSQPAVAKVLHFPGKPVSLSRELAEVNKLLAQLEYYQKSLQMLQIRTKKFQKCVRQLDKDVQSVHYSPSRTGTDA
ncbi:MAG: ATP-binding protein [Thiothrix sp.]